MKARIFINVTIRRFFELLFINIGISVILALLNIIGFLNSQQILLTGVLVGMVLYIAINIKLMRNCFFDLRSNLLHYSSNFAAYILFAALNLNLCNAQTGTLYTWLFAVTKILVYTHFNVSAFTSAIFFHTVMMIMVLLAPIGMDWVIMMDKDKD